LVISWKWHDFGSLSLHHLYELLKLRQDVFIIEQNCPYPELDGKDPKCSHLLGFVGHEIVAYSRLVPPGISYPELSLGRVVIAPSQRGKGTGNELLAETLRGAVNQFGEVPIKISAQSHLTKFYQRFGFEVASEVYLEDGLPHLKMLRP